MTTNDTESFRKKLAQKYRSTLLEDIMPFWEKHSLDLEHGGYLSSLDKDGSVVDTDKSVWVQGRMAWMFSSLFLEVERRESWLSHAKLGIDFLEKHCFAPDGKMFFLVTRDGRPLRMRRHFFSEAFAAVAFAAYGRAANSESHLAKSAQIFCDFMARAQGRIPSEPKWNDAVRPQAGLAVPMIALWLAQEMRKLAAVPTQEADSAADWAVNRICTLHYHPEREALLETVTPDGGIIDSYEGRTLNPGHTLEAAWFLLAEAKHRGDDKLRSVALNIVDWMWKRGWDQEYGGMLYFVDVDGKPVQEYWHDMKFWWPQNETEIAVLMAWQSTGEPRYRSMLEAVHEYQFSLFPDREHGEWFGYFHRDGRLSSTLKGNQWKSAFHIPRMLLVGSQIASAMPTE